MSDITETEEKKEKLTSKFAKIKILADRARQLEIGAQPMISAKGDCPLDTAIQELKEEKIQIFHSKAVDSPKPEATDKIETPE